jgi:DDE family transposase
MVMTGGRGRTHGKIKIGADDPSLTGNGGMLAVTELCGKLGLIEALDEAMGPVKQRARGFTGGQVLAGMAAAQLAGEDFLVGLDRVRADAAGQQVTPVPGLATSTAAGIARRFTGKHWRGTEAGLAAATARMTDLLPAERATELAEGPVTIDIDATDVEVYGSKKRGVAYTYQGQRAGRPHVASWAETEIPLAADLLAGDQDPRSSVVALLGRALAALPRAVRDGAAAAGRTIALRADAGYFAGDLARAAAAENMAFAIGAKRITSMWKALAGIEDNAWRDAIDIAERAGCRLAVQADGLARRHGAAGPPGQAGPRAGLRRPPVTAAPHPAPGPAGAADPGTGARASHLRLQLHLHQPGRVHPGQGRRGGALVPAPHQHREHLPRQQARRRAAPPALRP